MQHLQPGVEVVGPERSVPFNEVLPAPDVVHKDVQPALFGIDPPYQGFHLGSLAVIDRDGDAPAARGADQIGSLFDRLRAVVVGTLAGGRAAGAVHHCSCLAEGDGGAAARAARGPGDERDLARQAAMNFLPCLPRTVGISVSCLTRWSVRSRGQRAEARMAIRGMSGIPDN